MEHPTGAPAAIPAPASGRYNARRQEVDPGEVRDTTASTLVEWAVSRRRHPARVSKVELAAGAQKRAISLRGGLAEQLVELMSDAGVSQRELAAASGVPRSYLQRLLA